jgi:hypothetical protein
VLLERQQHPIGLLVLAHRPDGEAPEAELGRVDDRAARRACDGEADLLDEVDIAAFWDAGDRAPEDVEDVEADDRNVVAHAQACGRRFRSLISPASTTAAAATVQMKGCA